MIDVIAGTVGQNSIHRHVLEFWVKLIWVEWVWRASISPRVLCDQIKRDLVFDGAGVGINEQRRGCHRIVLGAAYENAVFGFDSADLGYCHRPTGTALSGCVRWRGLPQPDQHLDQREFE